LPTPKWGTNRRGSRRVQSHLPSHGGRKTSLGGRPKATHGRGGPFLGHGALGEDSSFPSSAPNFRPHRHPGHAGRHGWPPPCARTPDRCAVRGCGGAGDPSSRCLGCPRRRTATNTAHAVGAAAAQTAGLPAELHLQVTDETFPTSSLVGDLGLILKDIGGPTIPGMLAFKDLLRSSKEPVSPFRSTTPPLGHIAGEHSWRWGGLLKWKFGCEPGGQNDPSA